MEVQISFMLSLFIPREPTKPLHINLGGSNSLFRQTAKKKNIWTIIIAFI